MYDQDKVNRTVDAVRECLTDNLRNKDYRDNPHPIAGHCYVASEGVYHLLGGPESELTPHWVKHGPLLPNGKQDTHIFLRHKDGHIIDPTADQFQEPPSYGKGKAFGWMGRDGNRAPSSRALELIDRVVSNGKIDDLLIEHGFLPYDPELSKALGDIMPGKAKNVVDPDSQTKSVVTDYGHLLGSKDKDYKIQLKTTDFGDGTVGVSAGLLHKGFHIGEVIGEVHNGVAEINVSSLQEEHRGRGLGLALYEALLAHAKNVLGATHAGGFTHSSMASKVHEKLAKKHGLEYDAVPNFGLGTEPYHTKEEWEKAPNAPFDDKFSAYQYALKSELAKAHPTPVFPAAGVSEDRRETPILTTQNQLSTKAVAVANAKGRLRQIQADYYGKPKPKAKSAALKGRASVDVRADDISRARAPAGSSITFPEVPVHFSYAKGRPLMQDLKLRNSAMNGPMGSLGIKMHEDFHNMMGRIEQLYGFPGRKNFAQNLYNSIPKHYRKYLDAHNSIMNGSDRSNPEENLAYLINYMNDPDFREKFYQNAKEAGKSWHKNRMVFDTALKRAYRMMRTAAEVAPAEWAESVMQKSEASEPKVRIASIAVLTPEGKLLMGKRNDTGKWTLPGGHIEEGETELEGAYRELKEETGLEPDSLEYLGEGIAGRGDALKVYCYRVIMPDPKLDSKQDPDEEVENWEWLEVKDKLPKEVSENLHAKKNITLRLLGLQEAGDELLGKGLKEKFAALAAGATIALAPTSIGHSPHQPQVYHIPNDQTIQEAPKVTPKNRGWTADGLHLDLHPIAHLESNFGININHKTNSNGPMHTAYGALGFKPVTAFEEFGRNAALRKLHPDLVANPTKFLEEFKNNPSLYNTVANAHWKRLKNIVGSVVGAAYAWRYGVTAAINTHKDLQMASPYVQAYQKMFVNHSQPVNKSEVKDWLHESELIKAIKSWNSKDGVSVPVMGTPERAAYDQRFFQALDQSYGSGANKSLRPLKINIDEIQSMNNVHNHDRYNMYLRMARGGDKLPPVIVRRIGDNFLLVDGNHRWNAARKAKLNQLDAYEIIEPVVSRRKKTV